jgi:TRAP-type C4-dicarboxylate transport system permease small subunit
METASSQEPVQHERDRSLAGRLAIGCLWAAAAASLAVAGLGTADAIASLIQNRPIPGVLEVTELALVTIVFMAQPYVVLSGAHIALDLFRFRSGGALHRLRVILVLATGLVTYGLIAWTGTIALLEAWSVRLRTDGIVAIPVYPIKALLVLGSSVALIMLIVVFLRHRFKSDT